MNKGIWKWLTVASLGVIAALVLDISRQLPEQPAVRIGGSNASTIAQPISESAITLLLEEVQALRAEVFDLQRQFENRDPLIATAVDVQEQTTDPLLDVQPAAASSGAQFDPGNEAQLAEVEAREIEHFRRIDARIDNEPVDDAWSAHATSTLVSALDMQQEVELQLDHVDCRSTLCRVRIRVDPDVDIGELLLAVPVEARALFPRLAVRVDKRDPGTRILYLSSSRERLSGG